MKDVSFYMNLDVVVYTDEYGNNYYSDYTLAKKLNKSLWIRHDDFTVSVGHSILSDKLSIDLTSNDNEFSNEFGHHFDDYVFINGHLYLSTHLYIAILAWNDDEANESFQSFFHQGWKMNNQLLN